MRAALLLLFLLSPQDPATLIERLRDNDPKVREQASRALRALEQGALPVLRAAANDSDPEVKARVRTLIHRIEYDAVVDPALLARYPRIREAFLDGDHAGMVELILSRRSRF